MPEPDPNPTGAKRVEDLQFQQAEPARPPENPGLGKCLICQRPIADKYYQAAGHVVCPECAVRVQQGQQPPAPHALARAFVFGLAAAAAGCAIYAAVEIATGLEIGLISILVGIMVGRAIRMGSNGLGGRPQQIMAVILTYLAITSSYIAVAIYHSGGRVAARSLGPLLVAGAAMPFTFLSSGVSGILSLVIIFFGLSQAWKLTGRRAIVVTGPFSAAG